MADEEILDWIEYEKSSEYLRSQSRVKKARAINLRVEQRRTGYLRLRDCTYHGLKAAVNKCHFAQLSRYDWRILKGKRAFHPIRYIKRNDKPPRLRPLAHDVYELELGVVIPQGLVIVTLDGRGLDCRVENLRALSIEDHKCFRDLPENPPHYDGVVPRGEKWQIGKKDTKGNMNCDRGEYETQLDAVIERDARLSKDWHKTFPGLTVQQ